MLVRGSKFTRLCGNGKREYLYIYRIISYYTGLYRRLSAHNHSACLFIQSNSLRVIMVLTDSRLPDSLKSLMPVPPYHMYYLLLFPKVPLVLMSGTSLESKKDSSVECHSSHPYLYIISTYTSYLPRCK